MNLANKITIFRILLIPLFIAFILYAKLQLALAVFFVAAISDAIDGYVARTRSERTELGKMLDPLADKLLILSAFICLSVNPSLLAPLKLPVYVPIIIISRDAIIIIGALVIFLVKGKLEVKPTMISKATTFLQMAAVPSALLKLAVSPLLWNVAVLFTVITGEKEGTTRDRIERRVKLEGKDFILSDTGGFQKDEEDEISSLVKRQIEKAVSLSEVLLFVCDGEKGLSPLDLDLGALLRKSGKKIILVVNKIDNEKRKESLYDFYELGLGEIFDISCLHNKGLAKLLREIARAIPERPSSEIENRHPIKIAIVGRPNVGKSSFLNRVLDEERALVHEAPGTTRDSVDSFFEKDGILFLLIDTAGLRARRKVKAPIDAYSMMRSRGSIDSCDVALLLIDGMEGVTNDDIRIFNYITEKGKGSVIIVNKWDLTSGVEMSRYENAVLRRMPEAKKFPIAFISAKTGRNALEAFNLVKSIKTNLDLFISTSLLRAFLKEINPGSVALSRRRKIPKFYYMTQMRLAPKEFAVFVNDPERVTAFHTSFIENRLRDRFPLKGVPIRIRYRMLGKKREK
jgi:GTP-binding protein